MKGAEEEDRRKPDLGREDERERERDGESYFIGDILYHQL